jgi:hypothetical protein
MIEKYQLDARGVLRENAEIRAAVAKRRPERKAFPRPLSAGCRVVRRIGPLCCDGHGHNIGRGLRRQTSATLAISASPHVCYWVHRNLSVAAGLDADQPHRNQGSAPETMDFGRRTPAGDGAAVTAPALDQPYRAIIATVRHDLGVAQGRQKLARDLARRDLDTAATDHNLALCNTLR